MSMRRGDQVPDFSAELYDGTEVTLSKLLESGPIVLFFYPKAFSPGCTAQSCRFRDLSRELSDVGARAIGISSDDPETLVRFEETNRLGFPLISDRKGNIAKLFGAKRFGLPFHRRMSFVIDTDRRVLEVVKNELDMHAHADLSIEALKSRSSAS